MTAFFHHRSAVVGDAHVVRPQGRHDVLAERRR